MVKIPLIQREIAWTRDFVVRRQVATQSSLFMVVAGRVIKTTMEKWMRYDGNVLRGVQSGRMLGDIEGCCGYGNSLEMLLLKMIIFPLIPLLMELNEGKKQRLLI
ncbi:hypothetical protein ABFX02_09G046600 [Erythranthe guttata]